MTVVVKHPNYPNEPFLNIWRFMPDQFKCSLKVYYKCYVMSFRSYLMKLVIYQRVLSLQEVIRSCKIKTIYGGCSKTSQPNPNNFCRVAKDVIIDYLFNLSIQTPFFSTALFDFISYSTWKSELIVAEVTIQSRQFSCNDSRIAYYLIIRGILDLHQKP